MNATTPLPIRDIAQRLAEAEATIQTLRDDEQRYRCIVETANDGLAIIDSEARVTFVSRRLSSMLGYRESDMVGCSWFQFLPDSASASILQWRRVEDSRQGLSVEKEVGLVQKDGSERRVILETGPIRDAGGNCIGTLARIVEKTPARQAEDALRTPAGDLPEGERRHTHRMDVTRQLAAGVAHDFNNLLTVILGFAECVTADVNIAEQHRKDLAEVIKAGKRALGLTTQLLAFGRQQVLHAAPVDVNTAITEMTNVLVRSIGDQAQVKFVLAPNLPVALADRRQLEQVLINLVVNAKEAMPDGGTVTIQTKPVELGPSSFHEPVVPGRYVMITVTDTGAPVAEEIRRHLFEPFFTVKSTGRRSTGLGLSTTCGIVTQSSGYMRVESTPGRGTTFEVFWPCAKDEVRVHDVDASPAVAN